jgi:hypothetical protein
VPAKTVLYVVAVIVVLVLLGLSAFRGAPDTPAEWLAPIAPAVAVAGVGLAVFDRWVWRWPGVCKLHGRPVLHGTWHGTLASDWVNPETGQRIPPDNDVFLAVRQRYWSVGVRLLTKESRSSATVAAFKTDSDGVYQLYYVYINTPRPEVRHRSELHLGTVVLGAPRDRSQGLEGHYFTDRKTGGEMRFRDHYKTPIETHAAGRELIGSPRNRARA